MLEMSEKEKADKESLKNKRMDVKKKRMDDKKKKGPSPTAKACLKLKTKSGSKPKENANKVTTPPSQPIPADWSCIYCAELYSDTPDDGWVECVTCKEWAHDECSGVDTDEDVFECDVCKSQ